MEYDIICLLQFSATSIIVSHEPTSGTPCSSWILVFGLVNFLEKFASNIDTLQQQYITTYGSLRICVIWSEKPTCGLCNVCIVLAITQL